MHLKYLHDTGMPVWTIAEHMDNQVSSHIYNVFHVLRRFYSVNKNCSIVFQLHMITDYVSIVYRVTRWYRLGEN